jgi:quercetin dioxygenase-like cupin family protein
MNRHIPQCLLAIAATALLGCNDPTHAAARDAQLRPDDPNLTLATATATTFIGRANAGPIHVRSKYNEYHVDLKAEDNTDVSMSSSIMAPGGATGWHGHPGLVVVVIKAGALTFYEASDPSCSPTVHRAGTVVLESSGDVHIARNEGTVNAEFAVTQFLPAGVPTRIDASVPGNCPF